MATYSKQMLSYASPHNLGLYIPTLTWIQVHRIVTSATSFDEIWLWVHNQNGSEDYFSTRLKTASGVVDEIHGYEAIPPYSTSVIFAGQPFSGGGVSTLDLEVTSYNSGFKVFGYVNRIS